MYYEKLNKSIDYNSKLTFFWAEEVLDGRGNIGRILSSRPI